MGAPFVAGKYASCGELVCDGDLRKFKAARNRYNKRYYAYLKERGLQKLAKAFAKKNGVDLT